MGLSLKESETDPNWQENLGEKLQHYTISWQDGFCVSDWHGRSSHQTTPYIHNRERAKALMWNVTFCLMKHSGGTFLCFILWRWVEWIFIITNHAAYDVVRPPPPILHLPGINTKLSDEFWEPERGGLKSTKRWLPFRQHNWIMCLCPRP